MGLAIAGVLLFSGTAGMAQAATELPGSAVRGKSDTCLSFNENGDQTWNGNASDELNALGNKVQALVDENTDVATGTAFCSNFDGIAVFITPGADSLRSQLRTLAEGSTIPVTPYEVPASLQAILAAGHHVLSLDSSGAVTGYAPDVYTGALVVDVASGHDQNDVAALAKRELATTPFAAVPVLIDQGFEAKAQVTRTSDTPPYWMGGQLEFDNYLCSSGVPITVAGAHKLLTAGHCVGTTFTNNGNFVGGLYTTTYPGNADIYGDWQLLQGSTYAMRVFNGGPNDGISLPISGGVWGGRPNGSAICTSGRTTGQVCRFYVTNSYVSVSVDGVITGHLLQMRHDSNGGSGSDANGFNHGDSGGPCYFSDGNGGVTVTGIVTAFSSVNPTYFCTQLSGVRAWSANTSVG